MKDAIRPNLMQTLEVSDPGGLSVCDNFVRVKATVQ